jgi:hypothetical protein
MTASATLLDVVAVTEDVPESDLVRGQVGTVVEVFKSGAYLVEFSNTEGRTYAIATLHAEQLMVLHYRPAAA